MQFIVTAGRTLASHRSHWTLVPIIQSARPPPPDPVTILTIAAPMVALVFHPGSLVASRFAKLVRIVKCTQAGDIVHVAIMRVVPLLLVTVVIKVIHNGPNDPTWPN